MSDAGDGAANHTPAGRAEGPHHRPSLTVETDHEGLTGGHIGTDHDHGAVGWPAQTVKVPPCQSARWAQVDQPGLAH